MTSFPEPILSANIYCSKRLDDLIHRAIAPFWRRFKEKDAEDSCYLWSMRYAKCGEHLKVRLHGPEDFKPALQRDFTTAVSCYFETLGAVDPEDGQVSNGSLPSLDPEDDSPVNYPDRSILWTQYRSSPITMGSPVYLDDSRLVALFTRCLGEGFGRILSEHKPEVNSSFLIRTRQSIVMKLVLSGCAALNFRQNKRLSYLAYHRDWLMRYLLFKSDPHKSSREEMLERLDAKLQTAQSTIDKLADIMKSQDQDPSHMDTGEYAGWARSLANLYQHLQLFRGDSQYDLDPYAADPVFLPIFKLFHGVANQAGLSLLNETYLYHLLIPAAGETVARGAEVSEG
jgi:hypothetical protein